MKSLKSQSACALLKGRVVLSLLRSLRQHSDKAPGTGAHKVVTSATALAWYNTRIQLLEHTSSSVVDLVV